MTGEPERFVVTDRRKLRAEVPGAVVEMPDGGDPAEFAAVVDGLRAEYTAAGLPRLPPDVEQALRRGEARASELLRAVTARPDLHAEVDRTPLDELPAMWLASCTTCGPFAGDDAVLRQIQMLPFATEQDRDRWATTHAAEQGHRVNLVRQRPGEIAEHTGYAEPPRDTGVPLRAALGRDRAARGPRPAPLVAFSVVEGRGPDLTCRIPERAGAAWLLYAAHACLLGRSGSAGIPAPHRIMYSGRVSRDGADGWQVRIDGMIGATVPGWGAPVGTQWGVHGNASPADIEDAVEALLADEYGLDRHMFSVVCCADATVPDPPDPDADAYLRARRRSLGRVDPEQFAAEREQRPPAPEPRCSPACSEMHTFDAGCQLHVRYDRVPADVLADETDAAAGGPDPDYGRDLDE